MMKKRNIKKRVIQKASFLIFAEKLMENLKILNEIKACPNCKNIIESNIKICNKCGTELKEKLTFEENMNYIRAYIQDIRYAHDDTTQRLIENYKRIIRGFLKNWTLKELREEHSTLSNRISLLDSNGFLDYSKIKMLGKDSSISTKLKCLENELLRRGFPIVQRLESRNWSNSHSGF